MSFGPRLPALAMLLIALAAPRPGSAAPGGAPPAQEAASAAPTEATESYLGGRPFDGPPGDVDALPPGPSGSISLGPRHRWPYMSIAPRVFHDLVAIPANVHRWDAADWGRFGLFGGVTGALMLPLDPSPDTRLDRFIVDELSWVPDLWNGKMQLFFWGTLTVGGLGTWAAAITSGHDALAEYLSLTLEAVSVAQLFHVTSKLLIGREGPMDGEGLGIIRGPTESLDLFPAGTPSGHFATLYGILSVALHYWEPDWRWAALGHTVVGFLASMHVINRRHFLSDIVWGAAMGWYVGQWVVEHRSTHYTYREGTSEPQPVVILPFRLDDATGVSLSLRF